MDNWNDNIETGEEEDILKNTFLNSKITNTT